MKAPISSYEDYCRVWAEVYKKHAKHCQRTLYSCYVRGGIKDALACGEVRKPKQEITTDEDIIGVYIVRALVAQGMSESNIMEYTRKMQGYINDAERLYDCIDCMELGLEGMGVDPHVEGGFIPHTRNRIRYLWAKHGGFDLTPAED